MLDIQDSINRTQSKSVETTPVTEETIEEEIQPIEEDNYDSDEEENTSSYYWRRRSR